MVSASAETSDLAGSSYYRRAGLGTVYSLLQQPHAVIVGGPGTRRHILIDELASRGFAI